MADYFEEARQTDTTMAVTTVDTTTQTTALAAPSTEGPTIMAYPPGVSLATITIGAGRTMFGTAPKLISATVTPIFVGTPHVVHAASGWAFYPSPQTFRVENGEELSFELPHVNAEGWRDTAGNEFPALLESGERDKGWAYHAKFTVIGGSGQDAIPHRYEKVFQPLVGQTEPLDLDLVPDGQIGAPITAPAAQVTSVAGLTGIVTAEHLLALGLGVPIEDVQAVAEAAGDQAVIDAGIYTDTKVDGFGGRVSALESGGVVPESDPAGWLSARIANAPAGGVIDLMGRDITLTATLSLTKPVTLRNGTLRAADVRVALVNSAGVTCEKVTFVRTGSASTDGGACVYVQAEGFRSTDCHYSSTVASALVLQHGSCNRARIVGGTAITYARRQNAAGVYVSAGNTGNYGIVIDGVTVQGGAARGPDGIMLFDGYGCVVRNCVVRDLVALPDVTIPKTWTLTSTPNVWQSPVVRSDGPTRVLLVDGVEYSEDTDTYDSGDPFTNPAPNTWAIGDGRVYLNLSGADPNTKTVVSRIVSGYGITLYCSSGAWRTMSHNRVAGNHVENVDGFGIYLQLGEIIAVGNSSEGNVLVNTCRAGLQSNKLPFAAFGVIGGRHSSFMNDVIDGSGTTTSRTPGFKHNGSFTDVGENSTGSVVGMRVYRAKGTGILTNGGVYQFTNCHAANCDQNGFGFFPDKNTTILKAYLTSCEAIENGAHGVAAEAAPTPGANLHLTVQGGYYRKNSRGINLTTVATAEIGGGVVFDGNTQQAINVSTGNSLVHLDGVTFVNTSNIAVDNSVGKITTGRLTWGVNTGTTATRVIGTGAARVRDAFETLLGGVVTLPNAPTVPASNPSSGGVLYTEGGALKFRGSAGTVTTLGPA